MNTASYKFHLITKHKGSTLTGLNEYEYAVLYKSNSGTVYRSYGNWHEYKTNAKDAKLGIVYRMEALDIIMPLNNDEVLRDNNGCPYFVKLDTDDYEAYNIK
jgi:hypothetical protein